MRSVQKRYIIRKMRIKKKIRGTADRPRLVVYRSLQHIHAQVIDDDSGRTLAAYSTISKDVRGKKAGNKTKAAQVVGENIALRSISAGIKKVVFDRGGRQYHGRVKALAESARKKGLEF